MPNYFAWENRPWVQAYLAAMLEEDPVKLHDFVEKAKTEIATRLAELAQQGDYGAESEEIDSLDNALGALLSLEEQKPIPLSAWRLSAKPPRESLESRRALTGRARSTK